MRGSAAHFGRERDDRVGHAAGPPEGGDGDALPLPRLGQRAGAIDACVGVRAAPSSRGRLAFSLRKPGRARNVLRAYSRAPVVRADSLRSAATVTARRRSLERMSVALLRARAGQPGGTESVNPARRFAKVRHPGGGLAGGSLRSVAGSGASANSSSSPQPRPAKAPASATASKAVARTAARLPPRPEALARA